MRIQLQGCWAALTTQTCPLLHPRPHQAVGSNSSHSYPSLYEKGTDRLYLFWGTEGQKGPCWQLWHPEAPSSFPAGSVSTGQFAGKLGVLPVGSCGFYGRAVPRAAPRAEGSPELWNSLHALQRGPGVNRREHKIPGILLTAGNGNGEPKPCSACSQLPWESSLLFPTLHPCQESFGIWGLLQPSRT